MVITSNQVVLKALRIINEYEEGENPTGYEIEDGLFFLNSILSSLSGDGVYIPIIKEVTLTTKATQQSYIIGTQSTADVIATKLIHPFDVFMYYSLQQIPLEIIEHDRYFQLVRFPNTYSRPTQIYFQAGVSDTTAFLNPVPNSQYDIKIKGKFALGELKEQQVIDEVPSYFHQFMVYALARTLNNVYDADRWTEGKEKVYQESLDKIRASNTLDTSMNMSVILGTSRKAWTEAQLLVGRSF